jgi:hypothetical protein
MNEEETLSALQHALTRQVELIAAVAKQLVLDAYAAKATGVPFPFVQRFVQACHAAMAELNAVDYNVTLSAKASTTVIPDIVVSGGLAMASMSFAGNGFVTPALLSDLPAGARKQVISWQLFFLAAITLIVLAVPAAVLASDLPSDVQVAILAYDGIVAGYAAAYTFSDRRKRNRR